MSRKLLWRYSILLLILNVMLAGVAIFSSWQTTQDVAKAKSENQSNSAVLGVGGSVPIFNPNHILSNQTFSSTRVFPSQDDVQRYLDRVNSPLKSYSVQGKSASYWIFSAARGVTSSKYGVTPNLNPGLLLAYLEKEQSLLSIKNYDIYADPQNRIKTAMGYGCPDGSACDSVYFGFVNQLNWAAYQLQLNYNQAGTGGGTPYQVNSTITTLDEYNVFLTNEATAAQYRYTPHVYWGNYNLWKIIVANGWGVDSATYDAAEIDRVNLANKDPKLNLANQDKINATDMMDALRKSYNLGDQGEEIRRLQRFLRQEGYYTIREITGFYGTITDEALKNYRRDKNIGVGSNPERCASLISRSWQIGTSSNEVADLQQCLRETGFFKWPTNTGFFGQVTQEALNQAKNKTSATPASSCAELKNGAYSFGETSERVRRLQGCLRQAGVFSWPSDTGYFGPVTQEALKSWKSQSQTQPQSQSNSNVNNSAATSCEDIKSQTFKYQETSDRVRSLQECMRQAGFFTWPTNTGFFGPVTQEAYSKWKGREIPKFDCNNLKGQSWIVGETSERVKQLQGCMRQAGAFSWPSDTGYFGDATKAALIKWRGYF